MLVGLSRDRAFYPIVLIVIPSYYLLFAVMGGATSALLPEALITSGFAAVATIGFRGNLWLVVWGLVAHGVQDLFHGQLVTNPGVPEWWPAFCLAIDITMAVFLARLIRREASAA
jgi:hypothetical protein